MTKPRGRHPNNRLTDTRIKAAKAAGRYADGNGLYLVVDPSGAKRWLLRVVSAGKRRDLGLGGVSVVTLAEAREEARRLRGLARKGADVAAVRRTERQASGRVVLTFAEAARKVHEQHSEAFRNAKHAAQWLASLEADVFPTLGERPVDSIGAADVLKVLSPIWTTKPETARRLKQRIRVVMEWAKASGLCSGDNPTDGLTKVLPKHRARPKHHPALPYAALPAFLTTLRSADASALIRLAFEFLILTATRTGEALGARWAEIDVEGKTWTIPAERMKTGREHRVPLSARALEILEQAKALSNGGPFVFPGRLPGRSLSNMCFLMLLRRLGRDDITAHGFRSSFRDWAAERTNAPRAVCEAALAHVVRDATEAAYNRTDLFERRRSLMDSWSMFATSTSADVVRISA